MAERRRGAWITVIALFKFVKVAALVAAAIGAFRLLNPERAERARDWVIGLAFAFHPQFVPRVTHTVDSVGPHRLELLGFVAIAYAALFLVEGTGLWLAKRWAEYFTIIATGSLLPFEIYELARRTTAPRIVALVLNVLVVIYLVWHVRHHREERAA